MGSPFCSRCGGSGDYDGWHYRMHEAMARYQSLYGLKPIGAHRNKFNSSAAAAYQTMRGRTTG